MTDDGGDDDDNIDLDAELGWLFVWVIGKEV